MEGGLLLVFLNQASLFLLLKCGQLSGAETTPTPPIIKLAYFFVFQLLILILVKKILVLFISNFIRMIFHISVIRMLYVDLQNRGLSPKVVGNTDPNLHALLVKIDQLLTFACLKKYFSFFSSALNFHITVHLHFSSSHGQQRVDSFTSHALFITSTPPVATENRVWL